MFSARLGPIPFTYCTGVEGVSIRGMVNEQFAVGT